MTYCPYCHPTKRQGHTALHAQYYLEKLWPPFQPSQKIKNALWWFFLFTLEKIGLIKVTNKLDRSLHRNRSLIFFDYARAQNINVKALYAFGKPLHTFYFEHRNKRHYYQEIPLEIFHRDPDIDNKDKVKTKLAQAGWPVARGKKFSNAKKALLFARTLKYPLVVKPNAGSLSHHATYPVTNPEQLAKAIEIAQIYRPDFIIEEYIQGNLYRATVVGQEHVFVCQKEPANVIGDGKSTIAELIESHPREPRVQFDIDLSAIPQLNQKIYLSNKYTLSSGCDIIARTADTHPDNLQLFIAAAKLFNTEMVGLDFIAPDITRSYKTQVTAIIEANSLPYMDMHQQPSHGQPDRVDEIVWRTVLDKI